MDDDATARQVRTAAADPSRGPVDVAARTSQPRHLEHREERLVVIVVSRGRQRGPVAVAGRNRHPHRPTSKALDGTTVLLQDVPKG